MWLWSSHLGRGVGRGAGEEVLPAPDAPSVSPWLTENRAKGGSRPPGQDIEVCAMDLAPKPGSGSRGRRCYREGQRQGWRQVHRWLGPGVGPGQQGQRREAHGGPGGTN